MHMYFTYIYIKGTDRIIFQLINHKKKRKKKEIKIDGKKKKVETNHEIIFRAFIFLVGIGELLRANEKP